MAKTLCIAPKGPLRSYGGVYLLPFTVRSVQFIEYDTPG